MSNEQGMYKCKCSKSKPLQFVQKSELKDLKKDKTIHFTTVDKYVKQLENKIYYCSKCEDDLMCYYKSDDNDKTKNESDSDSGSDIFSCSDDSEKSSIQVGMIIQAIVNDLSPHGYWIGNNAGINIQKITLNVDSDTILKAYDFRS